MREALNRFVAVTDDGQVHGLVAAKSREEAEQDLATLGLTGVIYTKKDFKDTVYFERMKLEEKRARIIARFEKRAVKFDAYMPLMYVAEATLDERGRRLRKKYTRRVEKLEWLLQANEAELEGYDPDTDPDLRDDE